MSNDVKQEIFDYISSRNQMVLATSNKDHPWACTVYYVIDDEFNLYFFSYNNTIHVQHIIDNPKVSVAIADSPQPPTNDRKGIQLWGEATRVTDVKVINWFLPKWTDTPEKFPAEELAEGKTRSVFKIKPKQLKFFNTKLTENNHGYNFTLEFK